MTAAILSLRGVAKSFGKARILSDITLDIRPGERIALIGPNGAGKSTLFDLISGKSQPSSGDIVFHGTSLLGLAPFEIYRKGLSRSFQITNIFQTLSVYENLRCALLRSDGSHLFRFLDSLRQVRARAEQLMEQVGLQARQHVVAGLLTHAEQRALELAMTVAGNPALLLLDEPTAGMSRSESTQTIALIRRLTEGRTLLMVEHDMRVVFELADRIAVLADGVLIALATPQAIRDNSTVRQAYLGDNYAQT